MGACNTKIVPIKEDNTYPMTYRYINKSKKHIIRLDADKPIVFDKSTRE